MNIIQRSFLFFLSLFLFLPGIVFAQQELPETFFHKGTVTEILNESVNEEFGQSYFRQEVIVEVKEKGEKTLLYEADAKRKDIQHLDVGDKVVVGETVFMGETDYFISDVYRLPSIFILIGLFVLVTLLFIKKQGIQALVGLFLSFVIIVYYIIPQILSGSNPIVVSIIGTFIIALVSMYIAHGIKDRIHVALLSTLGTISFSVVLAILSVKFVRLFGLGTEEAFFLQSAQAASINVQGLLLGGMIIGMLGVLDDVTTAQAAAVEEIHKANTSFSIKELYERGISVGKEHIISLVNTLVLAYTGASLPLLLLFHVYQQPTWVVLNSEIILEEVVRMLVGSFALILAVPLTTVIAAHWYKKRSPGS